MVQNLIGRVEAATLKYDCNMAKQSAIIYLQLTKELGLLKKYFFFRAPALCAIFSLSAGSQLVSNGTKFNQSLKNSLSFSSNETHFRDCLGKGFEIPAYEENRNFEVKSVVGFHRDSLLKGALRI